MDEELKNKINKAKIISFDVFDTLLYRIVDRPEAIFEILSSNIRVNLFPKYRVECQINASKNVEKKFEYPHANMDEIYEEIGKRVSSIFTADEIKEKEIELEKKSLYANLEMKEVFEYVKKQKKRIIITTDMYLDSKVIDDFLQSNGYNGYSKIYDSADERKAKFNGKLFEHIIEAEKVKPSEILHIGDNEKDDIENAKKYGITTYKYISKCKIKKSEQGDIINSLNNGIKRYNIIYDKKNMTFFEELGYYVGGPMYIKLIDYLLSKTEKNHNLYFLSRDGYNMCQILKNKGKYLYSSRRALLLASIDQLDDSALEVLPPFTFGQTIKEILDYIRYDKVTKEDLNKVGFNDFSDTIDTLEDMKKFKEIYKNKEKDFLKHCNEEKENALKYFKDMGLFDNDSIIFDCGWHGSSQYLLEKFLFNNGFKKNIKFIYSGINDNSKSRKQLKNRDYESCFFDIEYLPVEINKIMNSIAVFELFFGAPENSVWYYDKKGPVMENFEREFDAKKEILKGIKSYYLENYDTYKELGLLKKDSIICNYSFLSPLFRLINNPTMEEAKKIGNIKSVDGFAKKNDEVKYLAYVTKEQIQKNINTEVYWPNALLKRNDIPDDVKNIYINKNKRNLKDILKESFPNRFRHRLKNYMYEHGIGTYIHRAKRKLKRAKYYGKSTYQRWIMNNETNNHYEELSYNPLISVVIPVYNVKMQELKECINSVLKQKYKNFELIMVDDCSNKYNVKETLELYKDHPKIKIEYHDKNQHISKTTNDAIALATGEFIAFMDCDDTLAPNALYEIAKKLNENKELDFIYSDEDKINENGKNRHSPFFKPDWSPDTFLSLMYTSHLGVYRKTIVDEIGGLRIGLEGAQDYDFTLRFVQKTDKIAHIPKILYHWRERPESIASNPEAKPYALESIVKLKEEYLKGNNLKGKVEYDKSVYQYRIVYEDINHSLISIIIPSKDHPEVLERCVKSIRERTKYDNYEIIVIDNGSNEENTAKYKELSRQYSFLYCNKKMDFNFSKMCNIGASYAKGEYLLFLNDDVEVITNEWLNRMLGQASQNHTGAVGAKLYYPNSMNIQHDGILNIQYGPSHALHYFDDYNSYYYCNNKMDYNYLAVTAACLMVNKEKFYSINGFDESMPIAYNDVDLCFKLYEKGYYNVVRNDVKLYHYESLSRGNDSISKTKLNRLRKEKNLLFKKHSNLLGYDPFFSPNLDQKDVGFSISKSQKHFNRCKKYNEDIKVGNIEFYYSLEKLHITDSTLEIFGYAFSESVRHNNSSKVNIILESKANKYLITSTKEENYTYSSTYKIHCDLCGFESRINVSKIQPDEYKVYLKVVNYRDKVDTIIDTEFSIKIG